MAVALWDQGRWDADIWAVRLGAGWGSDWKVWYQVGATKGADLTAKTVEMRWNTDSHTIGDGTWRGDIQPGKCAIRFWDPQHSLEGLDPLGAVWATYTPTGATFCWFYDQLSRPLVAAGDPTGADVVFNGLNWPARLTNPLAASPGYATQSTSTRMASIVSNLNAGGLNLPAFTVSAVSQSQQVPAPAPSGTGPTPYQSYLDQIRAAGADGVAWLRPYLNTLGVGTLELNYARWETLTQRSISTGQVVVGPPVSHGFGFVVTQAGFAAVHGVTAAATAVAQNRSTNLYGWQGPTGMRLWGDVSPSGVEYAAANAALTDLLNNRASPASTYIDTLTVHSGNRVTATGAPSATPWDPAAHVWKPTEICLYTVPGQPSQYAAYICQTAHTLTADAWITNLTLESVPNLSPTPLPA